ncbi:hypothetical protein [Dietzia alimentaria]|uniref:hypothetical protein n=1 Tax=Dietzia alimentaria TaxID=665550 RepID=UPI00029A571F|nr:hypothetical protein [Dietzia alimentaria]
MTNVWFTADMLNGAESTRIELAAQVIDVAMRSWEYRWLDEPNDRAEVIARALHSALLLAPDPRPARWWRVIGADNQLWAETSSESEARTKMRPGDTLYRLWEAMPASQCQQWVPADLAEGDGSADT